MAIFVYNITKETHSGPNVFRCFRGVSVLSNPYTHIKDKKTRALFVVKDRDAAVDMYSEYFDKMYGNNLEFTAEVDKIYERYKNGEDVYLGCYCAPQRCHCDIIREKLEKRLLREKILELKREKTDESAQK